MVKWLGYHDSFMLLLGLLPWYGCLFGFLAIHQHVNIITGVVIKTFLFCSKMPEWAFLFAFYFFCDKIISCESREERTSGIMVFRYSAQISCLGRPIIPHFYDKFLYEIGIRSTESPWIKQIYTKNQYLDTNRKVFIYILIFLCVSNRFFCKKQYKKMFGV